MAGAAGAAGAAGVGGVGGAAGAAGAGGARRRWCCLAGLASLPDLRPGTVRRGLEPASGLEVAEVSVAIGSGGILGRGFAANRSGDASLSMLQPPARQSCAGRPWPPPMALPRPRHHVAPRSLGQRGRSLGRRGRPRLTPTHRPTPPSAQPPRPTVARQTVQSFDIIDADKAWTTTRTHVDNRHSIVDEPALSVDRARPSVGRANHHI